MGSSFARGAVGLALLGAGAAACSLLTNLDDLGGGDGSTSDAATSDVLPDVPLPSSCNGAYECAIPAPSGWFGPFALYDGNPSNAPTCPTIAAVNAVTGYVGLDAGAASCGACASCSVALTVTGTGYDGGCPANPSCTTSITSGTCVDVTQGCLASGFTIQSPVFACDAPGPKPTTLPPLTYGEEGVGCAAQQIVPIDCDAGKVCVPTPSPPFDPRLCVGMTGDVACPGAPYSSKHVFATSPNDTRGCGACPCTVNDAGSTWTAYKQTNNCTGFSSSFNPVKNGCLYPSGLTMQSFKGSATGTCTLDAPSAATGSVTTTAYTVCCEP